MTRMGFSSLLATLATSFACWLVLSLMCSVSAHAICASNAVTQGAAMRLDKSVAPFLVDPIKGFLPEQIPLPQVQFAIAECTAGLDDTIITLNNGAVQLTIKELTFTLEEGAILVEGTFDVNATADLAMQLCFAPDASCPGSLNAKNVSLTGRIIPSTNSCDLQFKIIDIVITPDPFLTTVNIDECGLYQHLWALVYDWFRDAVLGVVVDEVSTSLTEILPEVFTDILGGFLEDGIELYGLKFGVGFDDIVVTPNDLTLYFSTSADAVETPMCVAEYAAIEPIAPNTGTNQPLLFGDSMISVVSTHRFLRRTIDAAWRAGWLCFDTRDFDLNMGEFIADYIPDASIEANIWSAKPPQLTIGPEFGVALDIAALNVDLELQLADGNISTIGISGAVSMATRMAVDPVLQALVMKPTAIESSGLTITTAATDLRLDEGRLAGFVENFLFPSFITELGPIPLSSRLFVTDAFAVTLEQITAAESSVNLDMSMWPVDNTDSEAPQTVLAEHFNSPSGPTLEFITASIDNTTPSSLIRHKIILDGVEDTTLYSGTIILTGLTEGSHRLLLTAIDLVGNEDLSPIELNFEVDETPPEIVLTSIPESIIDVSEATIEFDAIDNMTSPAELRYRYSVTIVREGPLPDWPLFDGVPSQVGRIHLTDLPEDQLLRITVFATDAVGNTGSAEIGLAVNASATFSGCSGAGGGTKIALWLLLIIMLMGQIVRRRYSLSLR